MYRYLRLVLFVATCMGSFACRLGVTINPVRATQNPQSDRFGLCPKALSVETRTVKELENDILRPQSLKPKR